MTTGRLFFAVAFLGLGIEHFVFQDFITGRAPAWPASLPGRMVWAYLSGVLMLGMSVAVITGKRARSAALLAGVVILVWALLRHIPVVAADSILTSSWTRAGKALTFFGGAFAIAATLPPEQSSRSPLLLRFTNLSSEFIVLGRVCLGIFLIITGIQHFMYTDFVASLIPAWFPGSAVWWTRFAGVALISGGVGLVVPQTAALAALMSGLMVFSWFWIVHLPRTLTSVSDGIAVFEALAVSGIALVIAGFLYRRQAEGRLVTAESRRAASAPLVAHTSRSV
jgi:uncharacterized membrane protein